MAEYVNLPLRACGTKAIALGNLEILGSITALACFGVHEHRRAVAYYYCMMHVRPQPSGKTTFDEIESHFVYGGLNCGMSLNDVPCLHRKWSVWPVRSTNGNLVSLACTVA